VIKEPYSTQKRYAETPAPQSGVQSEDGVEADVVGRVAVPLSRVLSTGKEAGWYEVRNGEGGRDGVGAGGEGGGRERFCVYACVCV